MKAIAHRALGLLLVLSGTGSQAEELFRDPHFANGFMASGAEITNPNIGDLPVPGAQGRPAWRLCQWGSRFLLGMQPFGHNDAFSPAAGAATAENAGKMISVTADGTVTLEIRGANEYEGALRTAGQPWPHLLVEQWNLSDNPIQIEPGQPLTLTLDAKISKCMPATWATDLDPALHTAQVSAFFVVHHAPEGSTKPLDMIWFGIPIYDARYPIPPAHYALDKGQPHASGKFICLLDGARFWATPTGDGQWHSLKADLTPLLADALKISQEHGHLTEAKLEELKLSSFNLGWEIPGPYDGTFVFRNISLSRKDAS